MRFVIPFAVVLGLGASGIALAESPARAHKTDVQERAISAADLKAKVDKLGYDVRRLTEEEHYFEAHIVDRASGGAVEARFDKSGELVRAKLAQDDREARERNEGRDRCVVSHSEHERAGAKSDRGSCAGERPEIED